LWCGQVSYPRRARIAIAFYPGATITDLEYRTTGFVDHTQPVTPLQETPSGKGCGNVVDMTELLGGALANRKPGSKAERGEGLGAVAARKPAAKFAPKNRALPPGFTYASLLCCLAHRQDSTIRAKSHVLLRPAGDHGLPARQRNESETLDHRNRMNPIC